MLRSGPPAVDAFRQYRQLTDLTTHTLLASGQELISQRVDLAQARLRLQELEAEPAKAELDLLLILRQIEQRRGR